LSARRDATRAKWYKRDRILNTREHVTKKGRIACLRCEKKFNSEHTTNIRLCPRCKGSDDWEGSDASHAQFGSTKYEGFKIPTDAEHAKKLGVEAPKKPGLGRATRSFQLKASKARAELNDRENFCREQAGLDQISMDPYE